jgi:hypothetical protein
MPSHIYDLSIHSRHTLYNPSDPSSHDSRQLWQYDGILSSSINNPILLTSLSLTCSNKSSVKPHIAVSNDDCTVKLTCRVQRVSMVLPSKLVKQACCGQEVRAGTCRDTGSRGGESPEALADFFRASQRVIFSAILTFGKITNACI